MRTTRAIPCLHFGRARDQAGYRRFDPETGTIFTTVDVDFVETEFPGIRCDNKVVPKFAKDDVPGQTSGIVQSVLDITARVASEKGGAAVSQALIGFHAQFQEERERLRQATLGPGQGQFESSFGVRAVPGAVKGRRSKEAKLLLATVLHPVAAECAKVEDSLQDRQA